MKRFYFTFGSSEDFPFQNGYIVVEARTMNDAIAEFRKHYPDRSPNCVNCAFTYTQKEWESAGMYYAGKEPFEVIAVQYDVMSANEYQRLAMRTNDGKMTERIMRPCSEIPNVDLGGVFEGCLGLAGEAGEFIDLVKKWRCHEKPFDELHAKKELGDTLWYVALICESFGWTMEEVMNLNIEKLKRRYPNGFTPERANNRKEGDV